LKVVSDTSVIVGVIAGEPDRDRLIELTQGADLIAPPSLHWELGNALAAQIRRGRLTLAGAEHLLRVYQTIPIQFVEVSLAAALEIAQVRGICALDAYMIACADKYRCPLLTLGRGLIRRRDGQEFVLQPVEGSDSPLDVQGLELGWSREEIVAAVREGRER